MATSKTCRIDGGDTTIAEALRDADAFAAYTGLAGKDALHLRLLAEELLGVARGTTEVQEGAFVIEEEDGAYRLQLSARVMQMGEEAKQKLLGTASSGKNALYRGVSGKLRLVADWYGNGLAMAGPASMYIESGMAGEQKDLAALWNNRKGEMDWSLAQMMESLQREQKAQEWDELERSVLTRLADDVRVGLRNDRVVITVYKKFC